MDGMDEMDGLDGWMDGWMGVWVYGCMDDGCAHQLPLPSMPSSEDSKVFLLQASPSKKTLMLIASKHWSLSSCVYQWLTKLNYHVMCTYHVL